MAEIKLQKRAVYAGDVHIALLKAGWSFADATKFVRELPTVDAVEVCYCRDCKHMEIAMGELRWCNVWNAINCMGDYGYCNYGERKGGQAPQREDV